MYIVNIKLKVKYDRFRKIGTFEELNIYLNKIYATADYLKVGEYSKLHKN